MPYRSRGYRFPRRKRNASKFIDSSTVALSANTQNSQLVYTATYPCTVAGIRLVGSFVPSTVTTAACTVAFVIVREGFSPQTLAFTGSMYTPEEDVLAWFTGYATLTTANDADYFNYDVYSKVKRRMQVGDRLYILTLSSNATVNLSTVQFTTLV